MNKYRKITAFIAAALLSSALMVPAVTYAAGTSSITINSSSSVEHSYEAYQIITGDISAGKLVGLKWGSGITSFNGVPVTTGNIVSDTDITTITSKSGKDLVSMFTLSTAAATAKGTGSAEFTGLDSGYYLIKDITDLSDKDDANSTWILETIGNTSVSVKSAKPTADKKVMTGGDESSPVWGETADYPLYQEIQFCLTATIPESADLSAYNSYKLEFEDSFSEGLTFGAIKSVKAGDTVLSENTHYTKNAGSGTLKVTINDIKSILGDKWGKQENVIEVIYTASLNEKAVISKTASDSTTVNINGVSINYSNNPYYDGSGTESMGKTPEDKVWVFTYGIDNTKYKDSVGDDNLLSGAQFRLYTDPGKSNEVKLIYDDSKKAYRPVKSEESATVITSLSDGTFNIIGIDAGTYYLSEVQPPAGYNKCEDIVIVISASHSENSDGQSAKLELLEDTSNMSNSVIDKSGTILPSTGGIGTKIFYVTGGFLVVGSGVLLITKKRMNRKEK